MKPPSGIRAQRTGETGLPGSRPGREGGFILIAVLWLLVALGAVGIHAALAMRTERLAVANVLDETRARQTALAGAEYARSHLTAALLNMADELRAQSAQADDRSGGSRTQSVQAVYRSTDPLNDPWRDPQGLVISQIAYGTSHFSLRLRDSQAALNLNTADEEMLTNFFAQGLELDFAQADRLAQAIADWRDEDDIPRIGGAEQEQYLEAGALMLPSNRYFTDLDELRYVLGMTPEIFAAAVPYLILQNSGRINVNAAPEPVLLALPGMTPAAVQEILRFRESGTYPTSTQQLMRILPGGMGGFLQATGRRFSARVVYRTDEVEILSDGVSAEGRVIARVRDLVVRSNSGALVTARELHG